MTASETLVNSTNFQKNDSRFFTVKLIETRHGILSVTKIMNLMLYFAKLTIVSFLMKLPSMELHFRGKQPY